MDEANKRINSLTSIRAFAAIYVVVGHSLNFPLPSGFAGKAIGSFINLGFTGVDMFFILSGYILSYVYLNGKDTSSFNKIYFWRARFARIYPVYFFAFLLEIPFVIQFILSRADKVHQAL